MSEFQRIFNPRADKAVKAILLLTNGHRYEPTQEEKDRTLLVLKDAVNDIAGVYGMLPNTQASLEKIDTTCIAPDIAMANAQGSRVEASRLDAKILQVNRSLFARGDVAGNVMSIPENQVTAYATQILARMCSKFEEPEAQPKNFKPKEEGE